MTPKELLAETIAAQRAAADPQSSSFVSANAGSGKTRVLVDRVTRLLLARTPPAKILCITFTKAAAEEMSERLFARLGQWAFADDRDLIEGTDDFDGLLDVEGTAARNRTPEDLAVARRLFAQALETPGGLKIQTIHAFCESVLRRFSVEAGVPTGFSVLDDGDGAGLLLRAIEAEAASGRRDADFALLLAHFNETQLTDLLREAASNRPEGDEEEISARLSAIIGTTPDETPAFVLDAVSSEIDADALSRAADVLAEGTKTDVKRSAALKAAAEKWRASPRPSRL